MSYEFIFLKGLLLTIALELAAGITLKRFWKKPGKTGWAKFMFGVAFASMLTLPYVWFIFVLIQPRWLFALIAELFAWLIEGIFYKYYFSLKFSRALIFSFALNLFSFLLGLLIFQYI